MRVLFVDDEPRVLEGLNRMLFHVGDEWDLTFVTSGEAALEELKQTPVDVIVTDMRMPIMNGAALLREVHSISPSTVRIILSGQAEVESALRAVPYTHQFLSKPCPADVLESAIRRASSVQEVLAEKTLREVVGRITALPPLPRVYAQLVSVLGDPDADADDVSGILGQDPAMCAKTLQLVNSSFFARACSVTKIKEAVVRLGMDMVRNLVLSVEAFKGFRAPKTTDGFSVEALQGHSMETAAVAADLLTEKREREDAFLAGALHDIGKLVLATGLQDQFFKALQVATVRGIPLHRAEREVLGVSHAEIGAYLLGIWGLPYTIVEAVANHHEPGRAVEQNFGVLAAVHVANGLTGGGEMDFEYLESVGVGGKIEEWRATFARTMEG